MNIQEIMTKIGRLQVKQEKELWNKIKDQFNEYIREFRISYAKNRKTAFHILLHEFKNNPAKIEFIENAIQSVIEKEADSNVLVQPIIQDQIIDYKNKNIEEVESVFQDLFQSDDIQNLKLEPVRKFAVAKLLELNSFPNLIIDAVYQKLFKVSLTESKSDIFGNLNSLIREESKRAVNKIIEDLTNTMMILLEKESFNSLAIGYYLFFKLQKFLEDLLNSETRFHPEFFDEYDFHKLFLKYIEKTMSLLKLKEDISENDLSVTLEEFYFLLEEEEYNLKIDPFPWLL